MKTFLFLTVCAIVTYVLLCISSAYAVMSFDIVGARERPCAENVFVEDVEGRWVCEAELA